MAIGDTVPTIDPLWGEGIHKGMRSGRAAAITADQCLIRDEPDTSAENISLYNTLWHSEVAPGADSRLLMTELLYLASNERYDTLLRDLKHLDTATLNKVNKGDKLAIAKLFQLDDLPLLTQFAKHRLRR